jgi:MATE family multidrug resistance protein
MLARVTGAPAEVVAELGPLPWLLALYLLVFASGGGALMLLASMADGAQAVQGIGLTALKRSGASLIYFAAGYGVMVAVAAPVAAAWGLVGLWWLMAVTNGVLVVLQGTGFHRHSARVGAASVGA